MYVHAHVITDAEARVTSMCCLRASKRSENEATANVELSGKNWFLEVFRFQIVQTRVIIPDRDIYLLDVEYFITLDQYQTFAQNV